MNFRKKRYLLLLIPLSFAALRFGPRTFMGPERRTETFFAIQRQWVAHWPFESGKYLPRVLLPAVLPTAPVWFEIEPRIRMRLDPEDLGPRMILETGEYETKSFQMLREHLSPGATFIDVGANFGIYSLLAAPIVGSTGHVVAVEPNPEAIRLLQTNIQASDAGMVTIAPVACADKESSLELYVAPGHNTGETSLSKANATQEGTVTKSYTVRARPLDDIVRESGVTRVDAIKLDVEGAEYLVLKGSRQTIERFHPMLLVEVVDSQLRAMGTSAAQLKELLRSYGYREGRHGEGNVEFVHASVSASR